MDQVFKIKTVAVAVPDDIKQSVVVDWLRENFSTVAVRPVTERYVSIEAYDERGVNQALDALQMSADLLRRRSSV